MNAVYLINISYIMSKSTLITPVISSTCEINLQRRIIFKFQCVVGNSDILIELLQLVLLFFL